MPSEARPWWLRPRQSPCTLDASIDHDSGVQTSAGRRPVDISARKECHLSPAWRRKPTSSSRSPGRLKERSSQSTGPSSVDWVLVGSFLQSSAARLAARRPAGDLLQRQAGQSIRAARDGRPGRDCDTSGGASLLREGQHNRRQLGPARYCFSSRPMRGSRRIVPRWRAGPAGSGEKPSGETHGTHPDRFSWAPYLSKASAVDSATRSPGAHLARRSVRSNCRAMPGSSQ